MKIAFTGHRPHKLGNDYDLKSPLINKISERIVANLQSMEPDYTVVGMALGIDTLAAILSIRLNIPFIAAIPLKGQEKMWPKKSQEMYHRLLKDAHVIMNVVTNQLLSYEEYLKADSNPYTPSLMDKRNRWMVDNSDALISVWDGTPGGTANCVHYAQSKQILVTNIDPKKL